ncbi:MAG: T9SS type A sorting domain-containing protein [Flavobacterium sp.]|nr:T9SS type A sorting domain-containing protein [Flavobacterium sp.]
MKKIYILFAFIICLGAKAQTMFVRPIAGIQTTYPVADIQKLTFDNGNMLVTNNTGASGTFALSGLRYVSFTDFNLGTTSPELATNKFYAYPNPASHILNISGSNAMLSVGQIEILSLEGRLLMQQKPAIESTPQVDISGLPQGMYLCKITNGNQQQIIKFIKQ